MAKSETIKILTVFGDGGMHAGRESRGPGYEMKFSQFYFNEYASLVESEGEADRLVIYETPLEWMMKELREGGCDAVKSDSTDAFFLRHRMEKEGVPRLPFLVVENDLFERGRRLCRIFGREDGRDPYKDILTAPDIFWLAISESYRDFYLGEGVPEENLYPFPMARSSIGFSFPEATPHIGKGLPEDEWNEAVREIKGNVLAVGTNERDYETLAAAARGLDAEVHVICDLKICPPVKGERLKRHHSMPMDQFVEAMRQSLFVVIPLKGVEKNFGQMGAVMPMALGKAVVATDAAALREHVVPGVTGETVPAGDTAALRTAIGKLIADPALRARYGAAAMELEKKHSATAQRTIDAVLGRIAEIKKNRR